MKAKEETDGECHTKEITIFITVYKTVDKQEDVTSEMVDVLSGLLVKKGNLSEFFLVKEN